MEISLIWINGLLVCLRDYINRFFTRRNNMPAQSSVHFYLNWAKERLDEMDAALAVVDGQIAKMQAEARAKAAAVRRQSCGQNGMNSTAR